MVLGVRVTVPCIDVGRHGLLGVLVKLWLLLQRVLPGLGDVRPQVTHGVAIEVDVFRRPKLGQFDVESFGAFVEEI